MENQGQLENQGQGIQGTELGALSPRERILQAALELFVGQGYFNTNVPDIGRKARCSVGSIYHHFLNKEEIARQLYDSAMSEFRYSLNEAIKDQERVESLIQALVKGFLHFSESRPMVARYLWLARHNEFLSTTVTKPTVVGFDSLGRKLTKVIKRAIRTGEIKPVKANVIWSVVFGIPLSYLSDWLDGYNRTAPSEIADSLGRICYAALRN